MKSQSYMTRALVSRDPRFARILTRLGYQAPPAAPTPEEELTALRSQYQDVIGKRAYHAWDAETLRAKIAEGPTDEGSDD